MEKNQSQKAATQALDPEPPENCFKRAISSKITSLADMIVERILMNDNETKTMFVLCTLKTRPGKAVVILSKKPFVDDADITQSGVFIESILNIDSWNDIYTQMTIRPDTSAGDIQANVIYPASDKIIARYSKQNRFIVRETAEIYNEVTKPWIDQIPESKIRWVLNILDGSAEADKLLFRDYSEGTGFVLAPDFKWDTKDVESMYLLAIARARDIKSIRDLDESHVPLLKNIQESTLKTIKNKYDVDVNKPPGAGMMVSKAHLLEDVIDNLERNGDYYKTQAITYVIGEYDDLYQTMAKSMNW